VEGVRFTKEILDGRRDGTVLETVNLASKRKLEGALVGTNVSSVILMVELEGDGVGYNVSSVILKVELEDDRVGGNVSSVILKVELEDDGVGEGKEQNWAL